MNKHLTGIDLRCCYCRILDKVWILAYAIVVGVGLIHVNDTANFAIAALIILPLTYWLNKNVFRYMPVLHGLFADDLGAHKEKQS